VTSYTEDVGLRLGGAIRARRYLLVQQNLPPSSHP
jgi:hypothetical protein